MNKEVKIYIASPYTNGDTATNVRRQLEMADKLLNLGYFPYTPLLTHFQHMYSPRNEHEWLELDFVYLKVCDAVLRLKPIVNGKEITSTGADMEEEVANENNIPVFYDLGELNVFFKSMPPTNPQPFRNPHMVQE